MIKFSKKYKYIIALFLASMIMYLIEASALLTSIFIYTFLLFSLYLFKAKLKIFFFFTWVFLIVLEIGLRNLTLNYHSSQERIGIPYSSYYDVYNNSWYYKYPPNHTQKKKQNEFNHVFKANELGIFDKPFRQVDFKKHRILCLGDSYTEGVGAEQYESWPIVLKQKLDLAYPDSFEVVNAGIGGSDIFYMWKLYTDVLKVYQPQEIIFFFNASDLSDIMIRGGQERFQPDSTVKYAEKPKIEYFYKTSYVLRFILHSFFGYDFFLIRESKKKKLFSISNKLVEEKNFQIKHLLERDDIKVRFIIHPFPEEIKQGKHFDLDFFELCRNDSIINLCFLDEISLNYPQVVNALDKYYWPLDQHFNAKGYELIADIIFKKFYKDAKK